jgi:uncharacterized membrane protein YecN with MAPEG domain
MQALPASEVAILPAMGRFAVTPVFPFYTAIYTGILGLLAALLTVNVIVNRVRAKVDIADGGVAALGQAIRAHGNFAEHTPLALLLIGFVEAFGYRSAVVNGLAVALLVARLLSAWGLNSSLKQTFGRQSGAGLTILVTVISAVLILYAAGSAH